MSVGCRLLVAGAFLLLAPIASGQTYPDKPIRLILAVPAGGTPDVMVRLLTPGLSSRLGQQLVVDNRGGAGGLIGAELAAKAAPDGYTLFFAGSSFAILPHLQKKAAYDAIKGFAPISLVSYGPYLLATRRSVPFKTIKELIARAKAEPGKINWASSGSGQPSHLAMELLKHMTGVNITHVPYKGLPQVISDMLGDQIDLTFAAVPTVLPHVKAGRLGLLGVTTAKRFPLLPDVVTISEAGVQGFEWTTWNGLLAPAGTPPAIVAKLNESLVKVLHEPDIATKFGARGLSPGGNSVKEFSAFIREEYGKFGKVVKLTGAKVE